MIELTPDNIWLVIKIIFVAVFFGILAAKLVWAGILLVWELATDIMTYVASFIDARKEKASARHEY